MELLFLNLSGNESSAIAAFGVMLLILILPFLLGYFLGLSEGRRNNVRYKY